MINKKFIQQLKKEFDEHAGECRQIISLANAVLHDAKKVIFALHRDDLKGAGKTLEEVEAILKNLENKFSFSRLMEEGSYRAAIEEYVEAKMFFLVLTGQKIDKIADDIMAELVEFDMRSYLRTKYDQAKGHLRKIEQINYEINLRK